MAMVRLITMIIRDKEIGQYVVPIVPDEARTFGMEGMFRQLGIYSSVGQLYEPVDADQVMYYREDKKGQVLQEGITEAGAMSSWIAAATAYANHGQSMIPFYLYYSMFGFQRVGDLIWAAGDMRARGFLIGGTAGRTTLAGEGLQHQDGHSHVVASTVPNCISYDPAFACELAVIVQDGLRRMYQQQETCCFYYITVMNENYPQPPLVEGSQEGIVKGMYRFQAGAGNGKRVQLLGAGAILREALAAADLLQKDFDVSADVWSVTSFNQLRREGIEVERWNMLHPEAEPRQSYVTTCLSATSGPIVAATDYIRTYADQIRPYVPRRYLVLGTDGFGRSDTRSQLRRFFEVNRYYIAVAALKALADEGEIPPAVPAAAIAKYRIDAEKPNPVTV
jgi:pyruvate dehydrogenase E1 component